MIFLFFVIVFAIVLSSFVLSVVVTFLFILKLAVIFKAIVFGFCIYQIILEFYSALHIIKEPIQYINGVGLLLKKEVGEMPFFLELFVI